MDSAGLRVLVVNDHAADMATICGELSKGLHGAVETMMAGTGQEALAVCGAPDRPDFDCLIVDLHLPDMSGLDVIRALRTTDGEPLFPMVLFIDTGQECKFAREALRAGALDYIAKEWLSSDTLACAVENTIERFKLLERLRKKRHKLELREREVAELAARERVRADELEALFRAAPAALWISEDRDCAHIRGNPASYELLRMPEGENVSASLNPDDSTCRPFREFRGDEPVSPSELPMQRAAATGEEVRGAELTLRFHDGTVKHIYGHASPLKNPAGEPYGAISAFIDITPLEEAKAAVRTNEERFRLATEAVAGMIYEWDPRTGAAVWSSGLRALTGFDANEAEPSFTWWTSRIHPEDGPGAYQGFLDTVAARGPIHQAEYRVEHRDGDWRHLWDQSRIVYDETGLPTRVVGYALDVTERVRDEAALRDSEKRLRRFATSDIIGVFFGDVDGGLDYVNEEGLRILGYDREEFAGTPVRWTELTPPEWRDADRAAIDEARTRGCCTPYEKEYTRKDGQRVPVISGFSFLDERHDSIAAFFLDDTGRKRAEKAQRDADRRKDVFLAILAHELRNPLAAIRTAVHLLKMKGSQASEVEWSRQVIERQVRHLSRLLDDLLDVSRIANGKIQLRKTPVDVRDVVTRSAESAGPSLDAKQHRLELRLPDTPLTVTADPARLEQVLSNLLTNAAKYTDNGGFITLRASLEGSEVIVRVRDNGIGIDADLLPRIFGLFTQVDGDRDRSQGGLGLGLTLVRSLVEMHGGRVEARSEGAGTGSEFTIRLPAADAPRPAREANAGAAQDLLERSGDLSRHRVLIVDDNRDVAEGMKLLLGGSGFQVEVAHDARAALEAARRFRPSTVLLDIGLPGMSGHELAQAFRGDPVLSRSLLIAVSGFGQKDDVERSRAAGFDHHLLKPIELESVVRLIAARDSTGADPASRPGLG